MSIASEITRISGNVADAYTAANAKGATMPVTQNSDNLATTISTIQTGTTPTGTKSITANGVYDVTDFASADVQVPTTAPSRYLQYATDSSGRLIHDPSVSSIINMNGVTDVGEYVLQYAFNNATSITGALDLSSLTKLNGQNACYYMCNGCTGITSVDLSNLTTISAQYSAGYMFNNCTGLTSVDLSSLYEIIATNACTGMFSHTSISTINLGSLVFISASNSASTMFDSCLNLTSADFSSLTFVYGSLYGAFYGCTNLTSVDLSHVAVLGGNTNCFQRAFANCTSLTSLSFPKLAYTTSNYNNAFADTLLGVTGCTVHFPAEWQTAMSSWSSITNGMGGTNTTILFDLPNVTTLDLSKVKKITVNLSSVANDNKFANITSVDLSNLEIIDGYNVCYSMFQNCTNLIGILDLGSLTTISGNTSCQSMFRGCTGLTSLNISSLTTVNGTASCNNMFHGCGFTSVVFDSLVSILGSNTFASLFWNCTNLTSVSFPSLKLVTSAQVFSDMLYGVTGCTVHFPSNFGTTVTATTLGGTNTTVLYDLPATA